MSQQEQITIEQMATFCKQKGFVYLNSEIYGGLSGFWDFGPLGVELKNNLKQAWWKFHVHRRDDIVGIDGSIITHPSVWVASGHVSSFEDIVLTCTKCKSKVRADTLIEDLLKISTSGLKAPELNKIIKENNIKCQQCGAEYEEAKNFNLMFKTEVGPSGGQIAYLRPETAQLMFVDFKQVVENARLKLPFGIAQMGRSFRNEISPRDFLFRCREFEQMEIEYFVHPEKIDNCPYLKDYLDHEILVYSADMQENSLEAVKMKISEALEKNIIKTKWHAYFLALEHDWFVSLGADPDKFRIRQHLSDEKSHYALDTWDLEYRFPFGWKELEGLANRTDFDLRQHMQHSKKDLSLFDEETKQKIVPYVICEPSLGVERAMLVFLFDAYNYDKDRGNIVLKLHPILAPIKIGVFPLVNKLEPNAKKIYKEIKENFVSIYDKSGSIGRRYARADEIGIPFCVTIDFETLKDGSVTIRDRNTTNQIRVKSNEIINVLENLLKGAPLERFGDIINQSEKKYEQEDENN